jgi:hypothetical protein
MKLSQEFVSAMTIQDRIQVFGFRMPPVSLKKQKLQEAEIDVLV